MNNFKLKQIAGVSLIELIIAMTVFSLAAVGLVNTMMTASRTMNENAYLIESNLIAEAYLNEILSKSFVSVGSCSAAPSQRYRYTQTCQYHNLDETPTGASGLSMEATSGFYVHIGVVTGTMSSSTGASLGTSLVQKIMVHVIAPNETEKLYVGYKTNFTY